MKNEKGSITIEAAILVPILCGLFLFFAAWFQVLYLQAKMQILLNDACYELSVDSYLLHEIGVVEMVEQIYRTSSKESIKPDDLIACKNALEQIEFTSLSQMDFGMDNAMNIETVLTDFLKVSEELVVFGELAEGIGETVSTEGLHFFIKLLTKRYVTQRIQENLKGEFPDLDVRVSYSDIFLENMEGNVVVEYSVRLPFLPEGLAKLYCENSSFVKLYKGFGLHYDKYNKEVNLSQYGNNTQSSSEEDKVNNRLVYITKNGKKYHVDINCFHIQVHPSPVKYGLVVKNKEACSCCCHDLSLLNNNSIVFTTASSNVFHMEENCHYLHHDIQEMSDMEAIAKGYLPCGSCSEELDED